MASKTDSKEKYVTTANIKLRRNGKVIKIKEGTLLICEKKLGDALVADGVAVAFEEPKRTVVEL